jgi:RecB family exonuclease
LSFSGYTVTTEHGDVAVSGKIDRIDAADGYFRVVDYKSSDTDFVPADMAAGISLQLPMYLAAAKRMLEGSSGRGHPQRGHLAYRARRASASSLGMRGPDRALTVSGPCPRARYETIRAATGPTAMAPPGPRPAPP